MERRSIQTNATIQTAMDETTAQRVAELQDAIISIFEEMIRIFNKYELKYSLVDGSLLGAIRHKGIIPWDDDLDIIMPREDFMKFREIAATELQDPFFFQDYTTDAEYPSIYAKVRNSQTTLIENGYRNLKNMNHGIFVDIFVADRYKPCLKNSIRRMGIKFNNVILLSQKNAGTHKLIRGFCCLFPRTLLFKITENILLKMNGDANNDRYIFINENVIPQDIFDELIDVPFDRLTVKISKKYDEVLTNTFGNYMTLPPVEGRTPKHITKHFSVSIPYKEYIKQYM